MTHATNGQTAPQSPVTLTFTSKEDNQPPIHAIGFNDQTGKVLTPTEELKLSGDFNVLITVKNLFNAEAPGASQELVAHFNNKMVSIGVDRADMQTIINMLENDTALKNSGKAVIYSPNAMQALVTLRENNLSPVIP